MIKNTLILLGTCLFFWVAVVSLPYKSRTIEPPPGQVSKHGDKYPPVILEREDGSLFFYGIAPF